jgi:hypothetical protein
MDKSSPHGPHPQLGRFNMNGSQFMCDCGMLFGTQEEYIRHFRDLPVNRTDPWHPIVMLMEESSEVIKECSKVLR